MPARPTVEQIAQVGVEVTPGVAVPATWRPSATNLTIQPRDETGEVRPAGSRFVTAVFQVATHSEGEAEGVPCYNEATRWLDLVFGVAAPTATTTGPGPDGIAGNADDTTGAPYTRRYTFGATRPTWTVEVGDATVASRATHVYATSFALEWGRNSRTATMSIGLGGGEYVDGHTLTAEGSVATLPIVPATPLQVELYADTTAAGYGTTRVDNLLSARLDVPDLATATAYLRRDRRSISDVVAQPLEGAAIEIVVDADAPGRGWRQLLVDSTTRYVRLSAVDTRSGYRMEFDTPVQVVETGDRSDEDSQYVARYTLRLTRAGTEQLKALLVNGVA